MAPLSCFIIFAIQASVNGSGHIDPSRAFASLAIISLLTTPAQSFLQSLPQIAMATGCLERVKTFLHTESRRDDRTGPTSASSSGGSSEIEDAVELETRSPISSKSPAVVVRALSARPATDSPIVLHDLDFQVQQGSLTMLVGVVGSGKSTLIKCLLGELKFESGSISAASKSMGYCSQSPWLPNATVRQIICGASGDEDIEWYQTVLHACAFDQDVMELPNHDDTLIGSRGVTLSGGQKQRLVCVLLQIQSIILIIIGSSKNRLC